MGLLNSVPARKLAALDGSLVKDLLSLEPDKQREITMRAIRQIFDYTGLILLPFFEDALGAVESRGKLTREARGRIAAFGVAGGEGVEDSYIKSAFNGQRISQQRLAASTLASAEHSQTGIKMLGVLVHSVTVYGDNCNEFLALLRTHMPRR